MSGAQTFYSFAATLIPALLLGGVIADKWKPAEGHRMTLGTFLVPQLILFALFAEVEAINAAITGDPSRSGQVAVIVAVIGGAGVAGGTVAWPWLVHVSRFATIAMAASAIFVGVAGVKLIQSAISLSRAQTTAAEIEQEQKQLAAAQGRVFARTTEVTRLATEVEHARPGSLARSRLKAAEAFLDTEIAELAEATRKIGEPR